MIRAFAMFVILAFASCVIAAPASAGRMNGKPGGGRNTAKYDNPTSKPPANVKKPATAQ